MIHMMLLFLILIGAAIYYLVENKKGYSTKAVKPVDVLKDRYINGEIDEETYKRIKKVIEK